MSAKMMSSHKRLKTDNLNCYSGYELPHHGYPIDRRILDENFTPEIFFDEYISKRRPVVLIPPPDNINHKTTSSENSKSNSNPSELNYLELWNLKFNKWSYNYLREVVGSNKVRIEKRSSLNDKFGCGFHSYIPFNELIDNIANKNQKIYLTTQDLSLTEEGMPEIMGTPCLELYNKGDFPIKPTFIGNLITMNINLWWGCSSSFSSNINLKNKSLSSSSNTIISNKNNINKNNEKDDEREEGGSSSGLHHDYHDNLYCLIKGKKKFTLFSPKDTLNMYTVGEVSKIYPNGRINYEGISTYEDGSNEAARNAMNIDEKLHIAQMKLDQAIESKESQQVIALLESELEEALDAMVDAENEGSDNDEEDDEEDEDDEDEENEENGVVVDEEAREGQDVKSEGKPVSFSQINESLNDWDNIISKYPNMRNTVKTDVLVHENELLYLPCGWFHEVFSLPYHDQEIDPAVNEDPLKGDPLNVNQGEDGMDTIKEGNSSIVGEHMAFNYWFHPPDTNNFREPYSSSFWKKEFEKRDLQVE